MPKKYDYLIISIPFILAILFLVGLALYTADAAPIANMFRSLLPETENQYYLGTTTPSRISWKDIIGRNLTITSGSATTTIGTGVSTLAGGFVSQASSTVAGNFTVTGTCTGCGGVSGGGLNQLAYWDSISTLTATQTPTATAFFATSTLIASRFPIASSTSFSIEDRLWVSGAGTSTFQGSLDATGNARFGTLRILGASKFPSGAIDIGALSANSLTITNGTGISGGSTQSLGGSWTITNTGVISNSCSGAVTCSGTNPSAITLVGGGTNQLTYWTAVGTLAATSTPTAASFYATSTSAASRFPIASTTSLSIEDRMTISGAGTSTISGGLSVAETTGNVGISSSTPTELFALGGSAIIGGQVKQPWFKLTDGATITVNCEDGKWQYVTLGGNRTLAFADCDPGESVIVKVKIGTAGQTLTLPNGMIGVVKGMGTTTQNASTWFGFVFFNGNPYLIASTSTPPE